MDTLEIQPTLSDNPETIMVKLSTVITQDEMVSIIGLKEEIETLNESIAFEVARRDELQAKLDRVEKAVNESISEKRRLKG